jgi:endonuclease YncB( thermonuclease family)
MDRNHRFLCECFALWQTCLMFINSIRKYHVFLILSTVLIASCTSSNDSDLNKDQSSTVSRIIDGDTIEVTDGSGRKEKVRLIGIDTPERGKCGYDESGDRLSELILNAEVQLVTGGTDDRDRNGRLLRYVDIGGVDAGRILIEEGFAIARYDSRDDYPEHDRESDYIKIDSETQNYCD